MFEFLKSDRTQDSREMADIADLLGDELTQRRQKRDVGRVERLRELLAEKARITDERDRRMQELESLAAAAA